MFTVGVNYGCLIKFIFAVFIDYANVGNRFNQKRGVSSFFFPNLGVEDEIKCKTSVVLIEDFVKADATRNAPKSQFGRLQNSKFGISEFDQKAYPSLMIKNSPLLRCCMRYFH